jgi:hypothetical protein
MPMIPDPELLAVFERIQQRRERREGDDPLMWVFIGVTLIALFLLAISVPWFAR